MMTPAERVVVEAARKFITGNERTGDLLDLRQAVDALEHERATTPPEDRRTVEITWGQVVEGDEVLSAKTGRWYPVVYAVRHVGAPSVNVRMVGIAKQVTKPLDDPVTVRRGGTGEAVDVLASVIWSAQTQPEAPAAESESESES